MARAIRAIDDGAIDRTGVDGLADALGVSARHLHRLLTSTLGTSAIALARARRARAARVLIETTDLRFADVAFASGFDSVRQFNQTVREVFDATPSQLRRKDRRPHAGSEWIAVQLPFRPPLHVGHLFTWLDIHAIDGVEEVDWSGETPMYRRSLRLPGGAGVVEVRPAESSMLARFRLDSIADLQVAIQRMRRQLDLDSDPAVVDRALATDPALAPLVEHRRGLRLPGEVEGIDAAIRAVIHQQVSVASARSVCSRLIAAHGQPLAKPVGAVSRLFPGAAIWASLEPESLGLPSARAATVVRIATAIDAGDAGSANRPGFAGSG